MNPKLVIILLVICISIFTLLNTFNNADPVQAQGPDKGDIYPECIPYSPNCGCWVGYSNCQTPWTKSLQCSPSTWHWKSAVYGLNLYQWGIRANYQDFVTEFVSSCLANAPEGYSYSRCTFSCS